MKRRVRAIIIEDDKLLLIHRITKDRDYWAFPGGGVEESDANEKAALVRECREELGLDVEVEGFYMETFFKLRGEEQGQNFYFCRIIGGKLGTGQGPEHQPDGGYEGIYDLQRVAIRDLRNMNLVPEKVRDRLSKL